MGNHVVDDDYNHDEDDYWYDKYDDEDDESTGERICIPGRWVIMPEPN